jgi:uncharacterized protein (TIGR03067 family)
MRLGAIAIVVLVPVIAAADPAKTDRDKLQGTWVFDKEFHNGKELSTAEIRQLHAEPIKRMTFRGEECVAEMERDEDTIVVLRTRFSVDTSKSPKTLRLHRRAKDKSEGDFCEYALEGEELRMTLRLANATGQTESLIYVFRRQK